MRDRIAGHGIEVYYPRKEETISELHRIIMEELTFGKTRAASKTYMLNIIEDLISEGAEGIVLGCTEFPLLIKENDLDCPVFNTTSIHAAAAVDFILGEK